MRKLLSLFLVMSMIASTGYSFVPLSNTQNNLGSYRLDATSGLYYDELDIISAHPVSLLEFQGNNLYTNFGNVRQNDPTTSYNPLLSYNGVGPPTFGAFSNTFVLGISGNPLSYFGMKKTRAGLVFQNFGSKTVTYNLDNVAGTESEGVWNEQTSQNIDVSTDGSIDRVTDYSANMKYYGNNSVNQWNAGIAYKGLFQRDLILGFSISNMTTSNLTKTGGTKSYSVRYLNDAGMPALYPAGTRIGDTFTLNYAENTAEQNSTALTDVLGQGRFELLDNLRLDAGVGLRFQNNYNPGSLLKNSIEVSGTRPNLQGTTVVYDNYSAIRNPAAVVGIGSLNYDDFTGLQNDFWGVGNNLYNPATPAPAITSFSDDRSGLGPIIRAEAVWTVENIDITGVFNLSTVGQKLDSKRTTRDYINTKLYLSATEQDNYTALDNTEDRTQTGDVKTDNIDLGVKFDLIKTKKFVMAFGGFLRQTNTLTDYTQKENLTEIASYTNPTVVNPVGLGTLPARGVGEGVWRQTRESESTNRDEVSTTQYIVPIGFEVPLSNKWTFRTGTQYTMTKTKTINKITAAKTTTVLAQTPEGAGTTTTTTIADPAADYLNQSTTYTEAHAVSYTYGVQWDVLDNLTLACNAFLDTNANPATTKATIFDLDTYRLLAIQAVFKF